MNINVVFKIIKKVATTCQYIPQKVFSQAFLRASGAVGDSKGEHPLTMLELAEKVNYAVFFRKMEYRQWKPTVFFFGFRWRYDSPARKKHQVSRNSF